MFFVTRVFLFCRVFCFDLTSPRRVVFRRCAQLTEGNSRLKHEWLTDQTQLVSSAVDTERLAEKVMLDDDDDDA